MIGTILAFLIATTDVVPGKSVKAPPSNDMFDKATVEVGYHWYAYGVTVGATKEKKEPKHDGKNAKASVWYSWTAPASGPVAIHIYDQEKPLGQFDVYTGSQVTALTHVKPLKRDNLNFVFNAVNGTVYHIAMDKPKGVGTSGRFSDFTMELVLTSLKLTSPTNGQVFKASQVIPLSIVTTETTAAIVDVKYFAHAIPINYGEAIEIAASDLPPYSGVWTNLIPGNWIIYAQLEKTNGTNVISPNSGIIIHPRNDNFADRTLLEGADISFDDDFAAATFEPGEDKVNPGYGSSVWYSWTAPSDGFVSIPRIYHNVIEPVNVFTGGSFSSLKLLTNSDAPFHVSAGTTLQIAVLSDVLDGVFGLSLRFFSIPVNNDFASAIEISDTNSVIAGNNFAATSEPGEPVPEGYGGHSVWFTWTAPGNGALILADTNSPVIITDGGRASPILISVYTGDEVTNLTFITAAGLSYPASIPVRAGMTYHIAVDNGSPSIGLDNFIIETTFYPAPENDDFDNRILLTGSDVTFNYTSLATSIEPGEPNHGVDTLWWTWTAPYTGTAQLSGLVYSSADGAVYIGDTLTSLTRITSSPDFLFWDVQAGTTYQIVILSGWPGKIFDAGIHLHYYVNGNPIEP